MAKRPSPRTRTRTSSRNAAADAGAAGTAGTGSIEAMLLAAAERGGDSLETGRFLLTFKPGALEDGTKSLKARGLRTADARDFTDQAVEMDALGDADAVVFPEVGVALVSGPAAAERSLATAGSADDDETVEIIEPEYFVFADDARGDYLRGFLRAAETIARDLGDLPAPLTEDEQVAVLGATWGMNACKVPPSVRTGLGIRVAVLDTGMDLGHPDFAGRVIVSQSFVGQPVQDLHSHGTHCIGTACGPKTPPGTTPRYGAAWRSSIFVGKVLTNGGGSVGGSVIAGMNWAIANNCHVISLSLGSQVGVQAAYTSAGQAALDKGLLIVAAAGNNFGAPTMAPANSPTIMAVSSVEPNLTPSNFSNNGKIEIAGPGRDVFSSIPMPRRYGTKAGTSMATPHVAGCAALWAQSSAALRGQALWNRLLQSAKPLPFPQAKVGRGLVQSPP